jgi:hypothetical protein
MSKRKKGPYGPNRNRRADTEWWKRAGEWAALTFKVLAYAVGLAVTLAGKGCGPS